MSGGGIELILQRIDKAVGRIDTALQECGSKIGGHRGSPPVGVPNGDDRDLAARNIKLQEAVTGAISQIDALIARAANGAG